MGLLTPCILVVAALIVNLKAQLTNDTFLVTVKTGNGKEAGTFSNVLVVFEDNNGRMSKPFPINRNSRGHLRQGKTDQHRIPIPEGFGRMVTMQLFRDNKHFVAADWYCEHIFVDDPRINERFYFPIERRIEGNIEYEFENYATCLPQFDRSKNARELTLQNKRKEYEFTYHTGIAMVKDLPRDEVFFGDYQDNFYAWRVGISSLSVVLYPTWLALNDINVIYNERFYLPESNKYWKEDIWFGAQRVQGLVPNIIELCRQIPEKLGVTEETVNGLLEGSTLQQALRNNKIFIVDLEILEGIEYKQFKILDHSAPIALFYSNKKNHLMPIAIQIKQRKGPNNPVYTPKDPPNTWLVAKIYYNNAEAQIHECLAHFGYTHIAMDGIITSTNRQLSPSHPIFKLLKPHYHQTLPVNKDGERTLVLPGKPVEAWSMGSFGFSQLLHKGIERFTFKRAIGSVESDARARGVWDKQVLPYYPFRDDAISMYNIIKKYVTTILSYYYDTPAKVHNDWELKNWRAELARPRSQGGIGIPDLPGSTNGFNDLSEVIDLVTWIISQATIGHAATHFPQYETYGYAPNYPAILMEKPPTQKLEYTEADILRILPNKFYTLVMMGAMRSLSYQGTNDLGDFEQRFLYDPVSGKAHTNLKEDLKNISNEVTNRNRNRLFPYTAVDPTYVPNSISI